MNPSAVIPVLEIGGSHVTAALVDPESGRVLDGCARHVPVAATGSAEEIIATFALAASRIAAPTHAVWGVALPGPFDYDRGIGLFRGVGKFDSLYGVDLRHRLIDAIRPEPADVRFLNDADAFAIGEWSAGAARGHDRVLAVTLGTGVGSSFLDRGRPVQEGPDVPPDGSAYRLRIDGRPLEETVSRRAILHRYRALGGAPAPEVDVRDIAELARQGDPAATESLERPMEALGRALAPWVTRFRPGIIVVGGGLTGSWDVLGTTFAVGLRSESTGGAVSVVLSGDSLGAALAGTARHVSLDSSGSFTSPPRRPSL